MRRPTALPAAYTHLVSSDKFWSCIETTINRHTGGGDGGGAAAAAAAAVAWQLVEMEAARHAQSPQSDQQGLSSGMAAPPQLWPLIQRLATSHRITKVCSQGWALLFTAITITHHLSS
jgi:hypothetical protein